MVTLELTIQWHMSTNNSRLKQYINYSPLPPISTFFIAGIEIFKLKDEISLCLSLSFYGVHNIFLIAHQIFLKPRKLSYWIIKEF